MVYYFRPFVFLDKWELLNSNMLLSILQIPISVEELYLILQSQTVSITQLDPYHDVN